MWRQPPTGGRAVCVGSLGCLLRRQWGKFLANQTGDSAYVCFVRPIWARYLGSCGWNFYPSSIDFPPCDRCIAPNRRWQCGALSPMPKRIRIFEYSSLLPHRAIALPIAPHSVHHRQKALQLDDNGVHYPPAPDNLVDARSAMAKKARSYGAKLQ